MDIKIPDTAGRVLNTLNRNGFEAYVVGGCVRDAILGCIPNDWDIATNALPDAVSRIFSKTIKTGVKHGTVTVLEGGASFEVTTFRIDGRYEDNRHPASVEYTASLGKDLSRRDFTMNAIAYHPDKGCVDPFGGTADIRDRLIRTVGNADERFEEDALRMLRAVRFSSRLDFAIHSDTMKSISCKSSLICNISAERIRDELTGILTSGHPLKFILLRDTGLLQYILPELEICFHTEQNNPFHIYNVGVHSIYAAAAIKNDSCLRWAMLLHDIGKPVSKITGEDGLDHFYGHPQKSAELASVIMNRLRFDRKSKERILRLIRYHDRDIIPAEKPVRKAASAIGADIFPDLLKVMEADKKAQNPEFRKKNLDAVYMVGEIYEKIRKDGSCLNIKSLAVNGRDLIDIGFPKGREIKESLDKLLEMVLEEPELNEKEKLLKEAEKIKYAIFLKQHE